MKCHDESKLYVNKKVTLLSWQDAIFLGSEQQKEI